MRHPTHRLTPWFVALLVVGSSGLARASEEEFTPWTEVAFVTTVPKPFETVRVTVKLDAGRAALAEVSINGAGGLALSVPARAWAGVAKPNLAGVTTTFERGYDPTPWFYDKIPYGDGLQTANGWKQATLVLAFQGPRLAYRALKVPKADGSYDWKQDKLE